MDSSMRMIVWTLFASVVFGACSYQREVRLNRTDLPEYIYRTPMENDYMAASVGVFTFREPPYASGTGDVAAELLYEELLSRQVFAVLKYEPGTDGMTPQMLRSMAQAKGYDLMIMGDIGYYFEGSDHHAARVDERMRVIDVKTNETLWYAKAVDIGPNVPLLDFFVVQGHGAAAPSSRTLFKRNAEKFARLLVTRPAQQVWTTDPIAETTGDDWDLETEEDPAETRQFLDVPFEEWPVALSEDQKEDVEPEAVTAPFSPTPMQQDERPRPLQPESKDGSPLPEEEKSPPFLNTPVYFGLDNSVLKSQGKRILKKMAQWLKNHPEAALEIHGHCDERGTGAYNMALGEKRAMSAKQHLVNLGVSSQRLETVSFGKERPIDTAHNEKAWKKNRRAEFIVLEE